MLGAGHGVKDANCDGIDPNAECRGQPGGCDKCASFVDNRGFFGGKLLEVQRRTTSPNGTRQDGIGLEPFLDT